MPRETEIRGSTLQKHVCNLPRAGFRSNICKITRPTTIPDNLSGLIPLLVSLSLALSRFEKEACNRVLLIELHDEATLEPFHLWNCDT